MGTLKRKEQNFSLILILSFLFCIAAIVFMVNELIQNQAYFTRSFGKEQELLVEQISKQAKAMLLENSSAEQEVIDKILIPSETSGNRYWFFTKGNDILFVKNNYEMEKLRFKKVDELLLSFKTANGYNADKLSALTNSKTTVTILFSTSKTEKNILASVSFFKINETRYSIGMCTTENYVISAGKIFKHNTYSIIAIVAVCMVLFSVISLGLLIIKRKNEEILLNKKTLRAKNIKIEELTGANKKAGMMYNEKTKLYGKEVLRSLLKKANRSELFPITMLFINLDYSENITYDDQILELVQHMHSLLPRNSVSTRTQEDQLVILFFKTEYLAAKAIEKKLLKAWSSKLKKLQTSVQTDVITHLYGQAPPIDNFEFWQDPNQSKRKEMSKC